MVVRLLRPTRRIRLSPFNDYLFDDESIVVSTLDSSNVVYDKLFIDIYKQLESINSIEIHRLSDKINQDLSILIFKCAEWISKNYFIVDFENEQIQNQYLFHVRLGLNLSDLIFDDNSCCLTVEDLTKQSYQSDDNKLANLYSCCTSKHLQGLNVRTFLINDKPTIADKEYIYQEIAKSCIDRDLFQIIISTKTGIIISQLFNNGSSPCSNCLFNTLEETDEIRLYQNTVRSSKLSNTSLFLRNWWNAESFAVMIYANLLKRLHLLDSTMPKLPFVEYIDYLGIDRQQYHVLRRHLSCQNYNCQFDFDPIQNLKADLNVEVHLQNSQSGLRSLSANMFIDNAEHLVSPLTGVVKFLTKVKQSESDMYHVYNSGHNWAVHLNSISDLKAGLRTNSQGKGESDAQAKAGAIAEAIERFSPLHNKEQTVIFSSQSDLRMPSVSLQACLKFSDLQYQQRELWNDQNYRFANIPFPTNENTQLEWSKGYDLINDREILLPSGYLFFGYDSDYEANFYSIGCSNGISVGANCQDSIIQGFLELIERDAVGIWWNNMLRCPGIHPSKFHTKYIDDLHSFYKTMNRELYFLDLTTDIHIPVIAAICFRTDKNKKDILMAFGAHFDPVIAAQRALGEINQFFPAVSDIKDDTDSNYLYDDPQSLQWWSSANFENQPYLVPSCYGDLPSNYFEGEGPSTSRELLDQIKQLCMNHNFDFYAYNYTKPNINISCTKTIVPQLSHFWARYGCDRLFEVPVRMGYLQHQNKETDFNPIPMFL